MTEPTEVPPPAEIPTPTIIDVNESMHALLLRIDAIQAHSQPTAYLISARSMVVAALGQVQAHFAAIEMAEARAAALAAAQPIEDQ